VAAPGILKMNFNFNYIGYALLAQSVNEGGYFLGDADDVKEKPRCARNDKVAVKVIVDNCARNAISFKHPLPCHRRLIL